MSIVCGICRITNMVNRYKIFVTRILRAELNCSISTVTGARTARRSIGSFSGKENLLI